MQHQFWITKQTLSKKLGRKEDDCIVSSDAQLDAKLELFHNIQMSCNVTQRVIDKYQESVCYLSQEINTLGRFLKDNSEQSKNNAGKAMLSIGKALVFCAQEQLILHEPLMRFYQELETFQQRAIGDTLQNVLSMEKARTEYRAALSWMKNISQQLDPDTSKQLEKFKKVQNQVRRAKINFDKLAFDCLQKVDLLAAARCNMFNQTLSFYQNKFINFSKKSSKIFSTALKTFDNQVAFEDIRIKSLESCQGKNNKRKEHENDKLLRSDSQSLSVDNSIDMDNLIMNSSEKLDYDNRSNIEQIKNLSSSQCLNEERSSHFENSAYYDELQKGLETECNNILNTLSLNESKSVEIDWNSTHKKSFLPSEFLKQTLNSVSTFSTTSNNHTDKESVEQSNQSQKTKLWMDFFEELDPLSGNQTKKLEKGENSFV